MPPARVRFWLGEVPKPERSTKVFVVPGDHDDHWLWSPRSLHEWLLAGSVCAFAKNGGLRWRSMWFGLHLRFWASLFLSGSMVRCSRINQAFLFYQIWSSTCKPTETDTFDDAFNRFSLNQTASKQSTTERSSEQMIWQRDEITLVAEIKWPEFRRCLALVSSFRIPALLNLLGAHNTSFGELDFKRHPHWRHFSGSWGSWLEHARTRHYWAKLLLGLEGSYSWKVKGDGGNPVNHPPSSHLPFWAHRASPGRSPGLVPSSVAKKPSSASRSETEISVEWWLAGCLLNHCWTIGIPKDESHQFTGIHSNNM